MPLNRTRYVDLIADSGDSKPFKGRRLISDADDGDKFKIVKPNGDKVDIETAAEFPVVLPEFIGAFSSAGSPFTLPTGQNKTIFSGDLNIADGFDTDGIIQSNGNTILIPTTAYYHFTVNATFEPDPGCSAGEMVLEIITSSTNSGIFFRAREQTRCPANLSGNIGLSAATGPAPLSFGDAINVALFHNVGVDVSVRIQSLGVYKVG